MSLEQLQTLSMYTELLKLRVREACGVLTDVSNACGGAPKLMAFIDDALAELTRDPRYPDTRPDTVPCAAPLEDDEPTAGDVHVYEEGAFR